MCVWWCYFFYGEYTHLRIQILPLLWVFPSFWSWTQCLYLCISTPRYNYHYSRSSNIAYLLACWVVIFWRTSSSLLFWHLEYCLACNWYTACTNAWLNEVYETETVTVLKKNIITISLVTGLPVAFHESSWCFSVCVDNDTYQISCGQNGIAYKITINLTSAF